jgi:hypothetical protein
MAKGWIFASRCKKVPRRSDRGRFALAIATSSETSCRERRWLKTTLRRFRSCDEFFDQVKQHRGSTLKDVRAINWIGRARPQ